MITLTQILWKDEEEIKKIIEENSETIITPDMANLCIDMCCQLGRRCSNPGTPSAFGCP